MSIYFISQENVLHLLYYYYYVFYIALRRAVQEWFMILDDLYTEYIFKEATVNQIFENADIQMSDAFCKVCIVLYCSEVCVVFMH